MYNNTWRWWTGLHDVGWGELEVRMIPRGQKHDLTFNALIQNVAKSAFFFCDFFFCLSMKTYSCFCHIQIGALDSHSFWLPSSRKQEHIEEREEEDIYEFHRGKFTSLQSCLLLIGLRLDSGLNLRTLFSFMVPLLWNHLLASMWQTRWSFI